MQNGELQLLIDGVDSIVRRTEMVPAYEMPENHEGPYGEATALVSATVPMTLPGKKMGPWLKVEVGGRLPHMPTESAHIKARERLIFLCGSRVRDELNKFKSDAAPEQSGVKF